MWSIKDWVLRIQNQEKFQMENKNTSIYSNPRVIGAQNRERNDITKNSLYKTSESVDSVTDECRPSLPRRKSSIFSIIETDKETMENMTKPKLCLPIKCQKVALSIFTVVGIAIIWLSLGFLLGYEGYARVKLQRSNISIANLVTRPERLLSYANLTNQSIQCPAMYIYTPRTRTCTPKCGEWGSCGPVMYYIERYFLILLDIIGIVLGVYGIISWIINYKQYNWKQFAVFICIVMSILPSLFFAALDFPGQKYLFCSNEDKEWDAVRRESHLHVHIYGGVLAYVFYSLGFWIWFTLINISLSAFFPLSPRLQSKSFYWKLGIVEALIAWGVPLLILSAFIATGGRFNLENAIEPPSYNFGSGAYIIAAPIYVLYRFILTTFLLLFHKIRWAVLNSQKYKTTRVQMSPLEKRFIGVGAFYIFLLIARTVYASWAGFTIKWNLENRAYGACIALGSPIIPAQYNNSIPAHANATIVSDLLPPRLRNLIPPCDYPCIIPFNPILVRMAWLIILCVTIGNGPLYTCTRKIKQKAMGTISTFAGKTN